MRRASKIVLGVAVVAAVGMAVYVAIGKVREKKQVAEQAVGNIQAELDALDPMTRAAVVAKLGTDAARSARSKD